MDKIIANQIIDELIELSNKKYGFLKVARDTLNIDILFIEKYESLKEILGTHNLDDIDVKQLPRLIVLKELIVKISELENKSQNRNVRMVKASKAYQKK